jgi:hypothetical protein
MTRAEVLAWLSQRRPAAPAALQAHVEAAITDAAAPLPDQLADLGRALLSRVVACPDCGRELALDLLAADAFITFAFEAQAEVNVDRLTPLAERIAASERP